MNIVSKHSCSLWMGALVGASILMSACGPQDGGHTAQAAPAAPVPAAVPAPATPAPLTQTPVVQAPTPAPAPVETAAAKPAAKPAPVQVAKPAAKPTPVKSPEPAPIRVAAAPPSNTVGAVTQIEPITETSASGVGAVAGGALGGVVGHQFGKGNGKKAMTVLGVVGGAVAGHQIEKATTAKVVGYRVQVQLDNGETRTFEPAQLDGLQVGDRVRVQQGQLLRV